MSPQGINLRELPQLLDSNHAQNIENFLIDGSGQLKKRKGYTVFATVAGANPITTITQFTSDIIVFGFADKLYTYTISTATSALVHTFAGSGAISTAVVGNYLFAANGTERIGFLTTAGVYALVADATAPSATTLLAAQGRLYAGAGDTVYWSGVDTGTNPPFNGGTDWTIPGTILVSSPNKASYRNAGNVKSLAVLGQQIVAFYDDGKAGFRVTSITVGTNVLQDVIVDFQRIDFGGFRGAVNTPKGLFYVNEGGVWNMLSGGSTNQPYSERDDEVSSIFGKPFFEDIDFSNGDIAYDLDNGLILVTCSQDSSTNNLILWYDIGTKAWGKITGWNISRFMVSGATIYGGSATTSQIFKLFDGYDDNTAPIRAEYKQEINLKDLTNVKSLESFFIQGQLSPSSTATIYFDTYDQFGVFVQAKKTLTWTTIALGSSVGFGSAPWGSGWGNLGNASSLVESFASSKNCRINSFLRVTIRIIVNDKLPININWFSCTTQVKYPAKNTSYLTTS
jgi:hypothetical protein